MSQQKLSCTEIDQNCFKTKKFDGAAKRKIEESEAMKKDEYIPSPPDAIELQASTIRFIAFIIIAVIMFFLSMLILANVLKSYLTYAINSRFPGPMALFAGTFFSTIVVAYICYVISAFNPARANIVFWLFILFNVCFLTWFLNLSVRADSFAKGAGYNGRGSFYIVMTALFALGILFLAWEYSAMLGILMLLAVLWIMYLMYIWIFDGTIFLPEAI
jgi:hypothetical protein